MKAAVIFFLILFFFSTKEDSELKELNYQLYKERINRK